MQPRTARNNPARERSVSERYRASCAGDTVVEKNVINVLIPLQTGNTLLYSSIIPHFAQLYCLRAGYFCKLYFSAGGHR
jgi:hypothetical protein